LERRPGSLRLQVIEVGTGRKIYLAISERDGQEAARGVSVGDGVTR